MFTGLIEEMGRIRHVERGVESFDLVIEARTALEDASIGESIAVDGACLTVTELMGDAFRVGLAPETRARTTLGDLKDGETVNLERALKAADRLGGHIVQGHVDGTGVIADRQREEESLWLTIEAAPEILRLIAPKGYVALNGASLTVVEAGGEAFTIMLIAHTRACVNLAEKPVGARINIETDILGKYIDRLAAFDAARAGLDGTTEKGAA